MATKKVSHKQPKEMYLLALTEMCQRFALGGIINLLVLYLVQGHHFPDAAADHVFGIFTATAYILPVFGGYIADRLNYRLPIIWGLLLTATGCFLMASGTLPLCFAALVFVAIGGAIFTPSVYALLGNLYHSRHHLREAGFSIYYSVVNLGIFLALIGMGALGQAKHWNTAFLIAGVVQLLGLLSFKVVLNNPVIQQVNALRKKEMLGKQAPLHLHEKRRIAVICILSFFSILFWMAYNQGGSSLSLFALRYTDRSIGSFQMPPSWILSSETLYLALLAFPLAKLYMYLAKSKHDITPPSKTALSLFAMGICFLIMVLGARGIPTGAESAAISPLFPFSAYAFMALGEMLICPIGLSLITHLSPHRYTAMLVGVWYVCIGTGFYLGGVIAPLMSTLKTVSGFFGIFVVISLLCGAVLLLLSKRLDRMRHLESL